MKLKKYILPLMLAFFLSGCVVFSFYPIYTEDDLFPNDYLLGDYITDDSASWSFDFIYSKNKEKVMQTDSTGYILKINENHPGKVNSEFKIHLIELNKQLIADFYLEDYQDCNENWDLAMFDLHIIPVHTFALVNIREDTIDFKWFNPGWLEEQLKSNKVRIHHEKNENTILLTAKPKELQKFVKKYLNSTDAFNDGFELTLFRKK